MTDSPRKLFLAVNCHGWEDFPVHQQGDEAAALLSAWTVLWHPTLLHGAANIPQWCRTDSFPDGPDGLIVVPDFGEDQIAESERHRWVDQGGSLVVAAPDRRQTLQGIQVQMAGLDWDIEEVRTGDFFSLGYSYLQVQLLTRQLRYSSSLDESLFAQRVFHAAESARGNCEASFSEALTACFDLLIEERTRYYPTTPTLIDLTLVAETTLGQSLDQTLSQKHARNLVASGRTLQKLADTRAAALNRLQAAIQEGQIDLAGGEQSDLPSNLLSLWTMIRQCQVGLHTHQQILQRRPTVFGRHRFGLSTSLPSVLVGLGFLGAVHSTFDDGNFPQTAVNNMDWEGDDGRCIAALSAAPRDATQADSFLDLGIYIGETLDMAHNASVVLVHWPGQVGDFYRDFVNAHKFGDILGSFVTLSDYFEQVPEPGYSQNYSVEDYQPPFLEQSVGRRQPNPISRFTDYWRRHVQLMSITGLQAMSAAINPKATSNHKAVTERLRDQIDQSIEGEKAPDLDLDLQRQLDEMCADFSQKPDDRAPVPGILVVNPLGFARRVRLSPGFVVEQESSAGDAAKIHVQDCSQSSVVMDVPPLGFARLTPGRAKNRPGPSMIDAHHLRNEFFEVTIDPQSGGIRAIQFYHRRGNLLSQKLALRTEAGTQSRSRRARATYSEMIATSVQPGEVANTHAELKSRGELICTERKERRVAQFEQTVRLTRGQRVIEIDIVIDPQQGPSGDPWRNYYTSRFAWNDEGADLSSYIHAARHGLAKSRIIAPMVLEIAQVDAKTSLLTDGLPYHRRIGYRRLDSLLIVEGEQRRRFRMGIGVNLTHPYLDALDFMSPPLLVRGGTHQSISEQSAWLFHLSCKNVVPLVWQVEEPGPGFPRGGLSVLLKETEGRPANLSFRSGRDISKAERTDLLGEPIETCEIRQGAVILKLGAAEHAAVSIHW